MLCSAIQFTGSYLQFIYMHWVSYQKECGLTVSRFSTSRSISGGASSEISVHLVPLEFKVKMCRSDHALSIQSEGSHIRIT